MTDNTETRNMPTPEEGRLAEAIGRELDPRAFDRSRFYNDMDYGFYKSRHMYQIDQAVSSTAFRDWLAEHDREVAAQARYQGFEEAVRRSRYSYEDLNWWVNPYRSGSEGRP